MANRSNTQCRCRAHSREAVPTPGPHLGLDELMIVNPSGPEPQVLLLGEDGRLYQVEPRGGRAPGTNAGAFRLGDDGAVPRVRDTGRYFLGADGTLYEAVPR